MIIGSVTTLATVSAFDGADKNFSDVDYSAYYAEGLNNMVRKGVITGYDDGTFRPNNTLSRAEFVTALDRYNTDVSNMKAIICEGGVDSESLDPAYKITFETLCAD